jgi:hypothetical protein
MIPAFNIEHYLESRASSTMAAGLIAAVSGANAESHSEKQGSDLNHSFVSRSQSWPLPEKSQLTLTFPLLP